jgi:hypothetical protein
MLSYPLLNNFLKRLATGKAPGSERAVQGCDAMPKLRPGLDRPALWT